MDLDPTALSAVELAEAIRHRRLSSREIVDAHLARIDAVNPALNAVVHRRDAAARAEADDADRAVGAGAPVGPLHGVPCTTKDCFGVAGTVTTIGTTGLAGNVTPHDDVAVARLRAAGAIVIGKTNTPEMMMSYETDNLVYGRTVNPFDASRTCGGSSGGEAAAVAAHLSPLGLASDSWGSTRVPAHFCGLAGLKPSNGRIPTTGFAPTLGINGRVRSIGLLARSVADLARALPPLVGPDGRDPWCPPVALGDPARSTSARCAWPGSTTTGRSRPRPRPGRRCAGPSTRSGARWPPSSRSVPVRWPRRVSCRC